MYDFALTKVHHDPMHAIQFKTLSLEDIGPFPDVCKT